MSRPLAWPLAGLASLALLWALTAGSRSPAGRVETVQSLRPSTAACQASRDRATTALPRNADRAGRQTFAQPALLNVDGESRWLSPQDSQPMPAMPMPVSTTLFPSEGPVPGQATQGFAESGPQLFPAQSDPAQPVAPPAEPARDAWQNGPGLASQPNAAGPADSFISPPAAPDWPPAASSSPNVRAPSELGVGTSMPISPKIASQPIRTSPPERAARADNPPPSVLSHAQASPLIPLKQAASRSRQMESIAQEADRHSRRAFDLASRKAYFAARSEFILALRLLTEGLDNEERTNIHSRALAAALTSLREAEDFLPNPDRMTAEVNVAAIVRGHQTPVLKNVEELNVSSLEAVKCYLTFAQEQMGRAVGQEVAGSMALHGLGKVHAAQATEQDCRIKGCESKAVVFFQASLLVFPRNYLASNDLGVLLARCGYFSEARAALEHSLSIYHQSTGWHNLAVVYRYLNEGYLARRAENLKLAAQQAEEQTRQGSRAPADQLVQWMDPQSFAQSFAQTPSAREPLPVRNAGPLVSTSPAASQPAERKTLGMKQPATAALPLPNRAY